MTGWVKKIFSSDDPEEGIREFLQKIDRIFEERRTYPMPEQVAERNVTGFLPFQLMPEKVQQACEETIIKGLTSGSNLNNSQLAIIGYLTTYHPVGWTPETNPR